MRATRGARAGTLPATNQDDPKQLLSKIWKMVAPGALRQPQTGACPGERGRRRTRQDQISLGLETAGEIADLGDPHRTKKTRFFCRTGLRKSELYRKVDPAV